MNTTIKDPLVKIRKFAIDKIPEATGIRQIEESLRGTNGITAADVDIKKSVLKLEYDLREVKFEYIEKMNWIISMLRYRHVVKTLKEMPMVAVVACPQGKVFS